MPERVPLIDQVARDRAVTTLDRDVLVAASAGTGKTTVLTDRVVHALAEGERDITRILVLTFTEAAAEEMRARIAQRLRAVCREQSSAHLRAQLRRLDAAPISTIHAFCKRTLESHFFQAGLDPGAQILDEDQGRLLLNTCRERVLAAAWADPQRAPALRTLLEGRNPDSLLDSMIGVFRFLEGVPDARVWLNQAHDQLALKTAHPSDLQSFWLHHHLQEIVQQLELTECLDAAYCGGGYLTPFLAAKIRPWLEDCLLAMNEGQLDQASDLLLDFTWPRLTSRKGDWSKEEGDHVKKPYEAAKKTLNNLVHSALMNPNYLTDYGQAACDQGRALLDLVQCLSEEYRQAKAERRVLDYADLEHRLLEILSQSPDTVVRLRDQYDMMLVDEYQDVNAVQQAIMSQVRRDGGFFAVGDVKQSIYGFRQARPTIFLAALEQANPVDQANGLAPSLRLDLQTNFRCRPEIIAFTNALFTRLMQPNWGGVAYDERACLLAGRSAEKTLVPVELMLLDNKSLETSPEALAGITDAQRQAAWMAGRIQRLVSEGSQIRDRATGELRAVTYGDIVILMRSPAGRVNVYAEILRLAGIPVSSQSSAGYFASMEVLDLLALLRVLDNPHQDVDLAAVLRSALLRFSDEELAEIRLGRDTMQQWQDFYTAVRAYAQTGEKSELRTRITQALTTLDIWRDQARRARLADMLWQVYRSTGYLSFVTALPNGAQRHANLIKLHDRAMAFEGLGGEVSLGRFIDFIERLLVLGQDWAPAEPDSAQVAAVRIMSIHRSKGLEFPVVFLADLDHSFNVRAAQGACLTDETLGLGLAVADAARNITVKSPAHEAIALARRDQDLAEELRILYVAVTRAREQLILCGSMGLEKAQERRDLGRFLPGVLPAIVLRGASSVLDWLLYALSDQVAYQEIEFSELQSQASALMAHQQEVLTARRELATCAPQTGQAALMRLEDAWNWTYPFAAAVQAPAKQSVSELSHHDDEFSRLNQDRALERVPLVVENHQLKKRFQTRSGVDPRLRGMAHHLIMETLELTEPPQAATVQVHIQALVAAGRLSEAVAATLDPDSVCAFFVAQVGRNCFAPDSQVWREWPFTLALPPEFRVSEPGKTETGDFVIVQGIVDLLIQRPEGLWVVDFKTDHINASQLVERTETYRGQLELYARAAEAILKRPILGTCLYFTELCQTVMLD